MDVTIDETSQSLWHRKTLRLNRFSMREVTMCIDTEFDGDIENPSEVVLWANPQIMSQVDRERKALRSQRITEQERKLQEQQLKALGYVD